MDCYQYGLSWCPDKDVTFPIKLLLIEFLLAKSYFYWNNGILVVSYNIYNNKPDF